MRPFLQGQMKVLLYVMLSLFSLTAISCDKDDEVPGMEQSVVLDTSNKTLPVGGELVVKPTFTPGVKPQRTYSWVTSNPEVAGVSMKDDYSAVVVARRSGVASITFISSDRKVSAAFDVTVTGPEDDGVIKVLAIGNSFSEDAVESYLYELAAAKNIPIVIGNLYIGGASLEQHWSNAQGNAPAYDYRKIEKGEKTNKSQTTIEYAVKDENWDYVSFQQVSGSSGKYETFTTPLPALVKYVKERTTNPETRYVLHQTWAYSENSTHSDFPNYGNDQKAMYASIVETYRKAKIAYDMDYVIPAGTAIQNGRNTLIGDNFTRDGYHLDFGIGRYTAASTWFEALTGISVVGNPYKPAGLTQLDAEIAQHAAHAAVVNPDKITILADYQAGKAAPLTAPVYVNFGHKIAPKWNTLGDHHEGASIGNLKDESDAYTNIALVVTQRFNAMNEVGESVTNTDFNMPAEVSTQSYYGNTRGVWQNLEIRQSQFTLSGLDKNTTYNLCFFGSRAGVGDNRETKFIVSGENAKTVYVQTSGNKDKTACADGIQPDFNGTITVTVTAGENNNNGSGFYYLNAMRLAPGK
ncbi:DUF4886 domain-containing protein [Pontibacter sp. BT731]|uniref:DUF4886 domain-containing protein n=1 Tax=Pontibacter coccineus TaxID=3063328 RepID=UPI0026E213D3|nr:DUF4886 domain-containing protein [Pontibacter sp. BT731]MDO6390121.1 DUF4886 domain-containing protein [Pontibacter sp. BT731]